MDLVRKSQGEEVKFMGEIDMYEEVSVEECWRKTGRAPTSCKWVNVNKGGEGEEQEVRCRMVARDFKPKGEKDRDDLFAATPPLEAKKILLGMAARGEQGRGGGGSCCSST